MTLLLSDIINLFKVITFLVYFIIIVSFQLWNNYAAWLLFGIHGTYGLMWASKTWFGYADKKFETKESIGYMVATALVLCFYWLPMLMIALNQPILPPSLVALVVILFGWGVYFHFSSDLHKTIFLQQREEYNVLLNKFQQTSSFSSSSTLLPSNKTFLKHNLFALCRNPNYFGELLIYSSFALCSLSIYPFLYLGLVVFRVWLPNMQKKDQSLSRFGKEYEEYCVKTPKLIPFIW